MLVNLNNTETLVIILVDNTLDTGGLSGSRITKQQAVIRLLAIYKSQSVVHQLLFGDLITHQIIQIHMSNIQNRHDMYAVLIPNHSEGFVQAKLANAILLVKLSQGCLHLLRSIVLTEFLSQFTDTGADSGVINLALSGAALVICKHFELRHIQRFHHGSEIKIIKFLENNNIMKSRLVDAAGNLTADLAAAAVTVLIIYQQIGQIAVPQVAVETVIAGQFDQLVDAVIEKGTQVCCIVKFIVIMGHEPGHIVQKLSVLKISVYH